MCSEELLIKTIAMFVYDEITPEEFTDIFFSDTGLFTYIFVDNNGKNIFGEDLYYDIIDTNFNIREQCISIKTNLTNFLKEKYRSIYDNVSDSYIEKIVEENNDDVLTKILAKRYVQPELAVVDFSGVASPEELIIKIRDVLGFPPSCTNWNAINDMIYDVMFPKKIIFKNCDDVSSTLVKDFKILEDILAKKRGIENNNFKVEYH